MNGVGNNAGDWLMVVRAIHFAGTAMIYGTLVFRTTVAEPVLRRERLIASSFNTRNLWLAWICLVIAVVSGVAWLLLQVPAMSGLSFSEAMTADMIGMVVTETQFGLISEIRGALAIVLAACLISDRIAGMRWLGLASALGLVASVAWTGHAGATAGEAGVLHLAADTLHLIAAAIWIGGLVSLALLLAAATQHHADGWALLVQDAVRRFSRLGILGVSALFATGIVNSSILVGSFHALFATEYGRLLLLKVALFAVMIGFASINRFWLTPRLAGDRQRDAVHGLVRNCMIEITLGLAIFAIVGVLGTIHPAGHFE